MAASPWLLSPFSHGCVGILQFRAGFAAQAVRGARLSPECSNTTTYQKIYLEQMEILRRLPVMDAASDIPTGIVGSKLISHGELWDEQSVTLDKGLSD